MHEFGNCAQPTKTLGKSTVLRGCSQKRTCFESSSSQNSEKKLPPDVALVLRPRKYPAR
jgi:hypothetical protein